MQWLGYGKLMHEFGACNGKVYKPITYHFIAYTNLSSNTKFFTQKTIKIRNFYKIFYNNWPPNRKKGGNFSKI